MFYYDRPVGWVRRAILWPLVWWLLGRSQRQAIIMGYNLTLQTWRRHEDGEPVEPPQRYREEARAVVDWYGPGHGRAATAVRILRECGEIP